MRKLRSYEEPLIGCLLKAAGISRDLGLLRVADMDDGGMGSLCFISENDSERVFGNRAAELQFKDSDGVDVIASLHLDQNDELFEVDVWKVDFSSLSRWPSLRDIADANHT